jgi:tripartite ATP-independent transporter DctP family solute receptor
MLKISRRKFIGTAAVATAASAVGVGIIPRRAEAAEFTYKYANNLPPDHPLNRRAQEAADRIREETSGRVELRIFPNSQLGSDTDSLSQLRSGGIEFFTLSGIILSTLVPNASISGVGFAFSDYDTVWKAMDGGLGTYIRGQIAKAGLVPMEKIWDNGFRQITTSTKPITGPEDLQGVKLRVPPSPLWTSMFSALGAAPTSINFNETYSALQTRIVDGQENSLAVISSTKLYEVQKYGSLTNHMWDGFWFLANRRAWQRLPEDLRAIVEKNINAAALVERDDIAKLNVTVQEDLTAKGMIFNQPAVDSFRNKLKSAGFYTEWQNKYGKEAWDVLEQSAGKLS